MATTQEQYIIKLKQMVIKRYGSNISSADDCAALSDSVEQAVGVRIDMPTLQMLFSRNNRGVTPRHAVLTALSKYVGYAEGWSEFCFACNPELEGEHKLPAKRRWSLIMGVACLVVAIVGGIMLLVGSGDSQKSTTPATSTSFENMIEDIKTHWVNVIDEQFMEVRIYESNDIAYNNKVASLKEEYASQDMLDTIAKEIEEHAKQREIIYTSDQLKSSIEDISQHCISLIETLAGEL